jgi:hypothetical protein
LDKKNRAAWGAAKLHAALASLAVRQEKNAVLEPQKLASLGENPDDAGPPLLVGGHQLGGRAVAQELA